MSIDIFVSYARVEEELVKPVVAELEKAKLGIWIDLRDIPVSVEWLEEVHEAIDAARLVVVFDTPTWRASTNCRIEEERADARGKQTLFVTPVTASTTEVTQQIIETFRRQPPIMSDHADLLTRADEWKQNGKSKRYLVGPRLQRRFRRVLNTAGLKSTPEMAEFVRASRKRTRQRRVKFWVAIVAILVAFSVADKLKNWASNENQSAQQAIDIAASNSLTQTLITENIELALRQVISAAHASPTATETDDGLEAVLDVPVPTTVARSQPGERLIPSVHGASLTTANGHELVLDAEGRQQSHAFTPGEVIATTPRGAAIAIADGGRITVHINGRLFHLNAGVPLAAALSSDGRSLALATARGLAIENVASGTSIPLGEPGGRISALAFAGASVVAAYDNGSVVRIVPGAKRRQVLMPPAPSATGSSQLAVSASGAWLATARGDRITILHLRGDSLTETAFAAGSVRQLAFSPDDRWLAAVDASAAIEIWDVSTGEEKAPLRTYDGNVTAMTWSGDGSSIWATTSNRHILGWRLGYDRVIATESARLVSLLRPSAARVLYAVDNNGKVTEIDPRNMSTTKSWKTNERATYRAATDLNGSKILLLGLGKTDAAILNTATGRTRLLKVRGCTPVAASFVPIRDGDLVEACSPSRIVLVDPIDGAIVNQTTLTGQQLTSLAVGRTRIVVGSYSGRTTVFEPNFHLVQQFTRPPVRVVAIDNSGMRYASIGEGGNRVLASLLVDLPTKTVGALYDLRSSDSLATRARAIDFSPDGTRVAVGFSDGEVDIIELARQTISRSFQHAVPGAVMSLAFSPNSKELLVASSTGDVFVLPGSADYGNSQVLIELAKRELAQLRSEKVLGYSSFVGS